MTLQFLGAKPKKLQGCHRGGEVGRRFRDPNVVGLLGGLALGGSGSGVVTMGFGEKVGSVSREGKRSGKLFGKGPQNTPLERTIGVGILVKARRGLPPLAAQRPC